MKVKVKMLAVASGLVIAGSSGAANAAITINVSEVGTSLFAVGFGTLNTAGFTGVSFANTPARLRASTGTIRVGGTAADLLGFGSTTTPFGTSTDLIDATSTTGDFFGTSLSGFLVASTYVSGSLLSGTATFANQSFASLGITAGQTVYSVNNDAVTINILPTIAAAVPEPASWLMMIFGMGGIGYAMRAAKRRSDDKFGAKIKRISEGALA